MKTSKPPQTERKADEQKDAAELASAVSHMASQPRQPADLGRSAIEIP